MNFCTHCGVKLESGILHGQMRGYWWCPSCEARRYQHPQIILTTFVSCGSKLLWILRRLEPRSGCWAIPGGFMERGESLAEGAARELREEAGIILAPNDLTLYMTGSITFINQIYIAFRCSVETELCQAGREALDVRFFSREECPWDSLAYPEVNYSIECAYDDLERGSFQHYHGALTDEIYRLLPVITSG